MSGGGVELEKILARESSAVEARHWVRLTRRCNNRCTFCLDSDTHDGSAASVEELKAEILAGRKAGATRLILSGGEPTVHPRFIELVRFGRALGYRRVQTVTNGRMFAYPEFARRSLDAGLGEVTFSVHGHEARLHDALVGVPGAFDEEMRGIDHVLADGRAVVNVDIVLNRRNVAHVRAIMERFIAKGIYEFDLLQIIPFGRAWSEEYRELLFYDVDEAHEHIQRALELKADPRVHIWTNRFPIGHLEGHEELIQDPHKLFDEVRGRMEQFDAWIDRGEPLPCREPARCRHCFLEPFCGAFAETRGRTAYDALRLDVRGGRPAALPARGVPAVAATLLRAEDAGRLRGLDASRLPGETIWLDLDDARRLPSALGGKPVTRVVVRRGDDVAAALAATGGEVKLLLDPESAAWARANLRSATPRLVLGLEAHELLSETARRGVDPKDLFSTWTSPVPVEDVPPCLCGPAARPGAARSFDARWLDDAGRFSMLGFVASFVVDAYFVKSLRCRPCSHSAACRGLHINTARRFGFAMLTPR